MANTYPPQKKEIGKYKKSDIFYISQPTNKQAIKQQKHISIWHTEHCKFNDFFPLLNNWK